METCMSCRRPTVMDGTCLHCRQSAGAAGGERRPPDGLRYDARAGAHVFERRWTRSPYGFLSILTTAGLVVWTVTSRMTGMQMDARVELLLPYLLPAGILLSAVTLVNSTKVVIAPDRLETASGPIPLPFLKGFVIPRGSIARIRSEQYTSVDGDNTGNNYEVSVRNTDGESFTVAAFSERNKDVAEHLAWLMQKVLGVHDKGDER